MRHPYRCDTCGCYLDPGEGSQCDKCKQDEMERMKKRQMAQESIHLVDEWQYEMNFDGGMAI